MGLFDRLFQSRNIDTKRLHELSFERFYSVVKPGEDITTLVVLLWLMVRAGLFEQAMDYAQRVRKDYSDLAYPIDEVMMYCLYQRHDIEGGDAIMKQIKSEIKNSGLFTEAERKENSLGLGLMKKYLNPKVFPDARLRSTVYETVVMYIPLLKHGAMAAYEAGMMKRCVDMCEQHLKADSEDTETACVMADAYIRMKQTENAVKCLKFASRIDPFCAGIWQRLADIEEAIGKYADAAKSHERWMCMQSETGDEWMAKYARCLRKSGALTKARSFCAEADERGGIGAATRWEYAKILEEIGDYASAISQYETANSGRGEENAMVRIATCWRLLGMTDKAREWAEKAISKSRDKATKTIANLVLAEIEIDEEKPIGAELRCAQINPDTEEAQIKWARIMVKALLMQGKCAEAKQFLQSIGEKGGEEGVVLMAATLYKEQKKLDAVDVMLLPCQMHPELEDVFYDQCPEAREDAIFQGRYKQILAYIARTATEEKGRKLKW